MRLCVCVCMRVCVHDWVAWAWKVCIDISMCVCVCMHICVHTCAQNCRTKELEVRVYWHGTVYDYGILGHWVDSNLALCLRPLHNSATPPPLQKVALTPSS